MRTKVLSAIMVYNGVTYHNGDYCEVGSEDELQTLVRERCVEKIVEKKEQTRSGSTVKMQERRK